MLLCAVCAHGVTRLAPGERATLRHLEGPRGPPIPPAHCQCVRAGPGKHTCATLSLPPGPQPASRPPESRSLQPPGPCCLSRARRTRREGGGAGGGGAPSRGLGISVAPHDAPPAAKWRIVIIYTSPLPTPVLPGRQAGSLPLAPHTSRRQLGDSEEAYPTHYTCFPSIELLRTLFCGCLFGSIQPQPPSPQAYVRYHLAAAFQTISCHHQKS